MKKIVVTGATSMIGTAFIMEAIRNKVEVYAIVRSGTNRLKRLPDTPLIHLVYSDLKDLKNIDSLPTDCDVFYHFAWAGTSRTERDDPQIQEKNIPYTFDAVELAAKCGCKKFIGAGSQAEYGRVDGVIDDSTKFSPELSYGIAKYAASLFVKKLCDKIGMVYIWGRIFSVYGKYDNDNTMLDYAIKCFLNKERAQFSAGTQMWNYLYEEDAGKIFYLLGEYVEKSGDYPVANVSSRPLRNYIEELADLMNAKDLCQFAGAVSDKTPPGLQADIQKLTDAIGEISFTDFQNGISHVIAYYKKSTNK